MILQEAGDHVPHISEHFYTYTDGNDLANLLNKDTLVSGRRGLTHLRGLHKQRHMETCSSCCTWLATAPLVLLTLPQSRSAQLHIHNNVPKNRDASTSLLQRLREHMILRCVDFIGGDFNMSAFSTLGDVFSDLEIAAPGNSLSCGALVALTRPVMNARASSPCRGICTHGGFTPTAVTSPNSIDDCSFFLKKNYKFHDFCGDFLSDMPYFVNPSLCTLSA